MSKVEAKAQGIGLIQHLLLSAYWFGTNFLWGGLLAVGLPSQMRDFDPVNYSVRLGQLISFGAFCALVVPLIAGPLSDRSTNRFGRRRPFLVLGGITTALGVGLMWLATSSHSIQLYFAGYFVLQFGSNTALAAYSGVIPDMVPAHERGFASGMMAVMSQIGTLAGVMTVATTIKDHADIAYAALGLVLLAFLALTILGLRSEQRFHPGEDFDPSFNVPGYLKALLHPLQNHDFLWVWITRAMVMLGFYAIQPFILDYLKDVIRVDKAEGAVQQVIGIILICATISGIVGGKLSDRVGRKPIVFFSNLAMAVLGFAFIFLKDLSQVLLVGVFFGLAYGAYISVDWALGTDVLPSAEDSGKDMAVWHVSMTLPQQISPVICGSILSRFHVEGQGNAPIGYEITFALAASFFVLGAVFLRQIRGAR